MQARDRAILGCVLVLVGAAVLVWRAVLAQGGSGTLTVAFLDVGQGDALYIEAPHGQQLLIDGGAGAAVLEALGGVMPAGDRSLDVVMATHPDADHIGGLPEVFARYDIGMFLEPGIHDTGGDSTALEHAVAEEGLTPILAREGMVLALDEGVSLEILFPDRDVSDVDPNVGSIVARLTYGDTSFLLTGDSPTEIEAYLVSRYRERLTSDVLKLGHHGSRTSTSESFLGFVNPSRAVVSAGCDNSYGHPHQEVLDRLARFSVATLSTCKEGTVVLASDGSTVRER